MNTVNPGPVNTTRWDTLEKAFARDLGVDQQTAHELAESTSRSGGSASPRRWRTSWSSSLRRRASFVHGAHIPIDGGQRKAIMDMGASAARVEARA